MQKRFFISGEREGGKVENSAVSKGEIIELANGGILDQVIISRNFPILEVEVSPSGIFSDHRFVKVEASIAHICCFKTKLTIKLQKIIHSVKSSSISTSLSEDRQLRTTGFESFPEITENDLVKTIFDSPSKTCSLDIMPTNILKSI
ncbi:hypothetical protein HELRODRAFT_179084 [Helobdella robusta]|uniref:Uncharacterized protein n=1 Tax=Helobdella robusta TaxID=6412 RepID=T1FE55_HELRO|nr:hypothetical protein HELRODRAFT_179084 [Helobdella robusta]ESN95625.1 hypothetical protein HELRODRAFT_179084 [Helobdella robusta]